MDGGDCPALHVFATLTPEQMLEGGKMGYFETTALA